VEVIGSSITVLKCEKFGLKHIESFINGLPLNFKKKMDLIEEIIHYWLLKQENSVKKEIIDDCYVLEVDLCWGFFYR